MVSGEMLPDDELSWARWAAEWRLRAGTTFLNHGSFGPPPEPVRRARAAWQDELDRQPMDFLFRKLEPAWFAARERLAQFVGAAAGDLIFVENATVGMNLVADAFPLAAGDEVLLTDHEYAAVVRIWTRACERAGATLNVVRLPLPFTTAEETAAAVLAAAGGRTRLVVVSHITSPTAVTLPVAEICRGARDRGMAVAIDGPHALVQADVGIDDLGCDFYTASCHKWLSAPFGSGFLHVSGRWQGRIRPSVLSWGRLPPHSPQAWSDEFLWSGTRDYSAYLSIPAAIDFIEGVGIENFRRRTHALARYARGRIVELTGLEPIVPDTPDWYCSMAHVPLWPGDRQRLQDVLWREHGIETPIVDWNGRRYARVSCHLYNVPEHIDRLVAALAAARLRGD